MAVEQCQDSYGTLMEIYGFEGAVERMLQVYLGGMRAKIEG